MLLHISQIGISPSPAHELQWRPRGARARMAQMTCAQFLRCVPRLASVLACLLTLPIWAQSSDRPLPANDIAAPALDSEQIMQRIEEHEQTQLQALERYHALRHYSVQYRGFFKTISAAIDVEIEYEPSTGKYFRIVSESGSHALCEKVLRRAVDTEREASLNQRATELSAANYNAQLVGTDTLDGRTTYVLNVTPKTSSKYLYQGKIWVDAEDFAVSKMEVQPASNPSFLISHTLIHHTNARVGDFWLPHMNRSETKVRIGGAAVMTIDYGTYQIMPSQALAKKLPAERAHGIAIARPNSGWAHACGRPKMLHPFRLASPCRPYPSYI